MYPAETKGKYPMTMSAMSSNYQKMWSWQPRPLSSNAGLSYNLQKQVAAQNAHTGSKIDVSKQIAASGAQMFLNIMA